MAKDTGYIRWKRSDYITLGKAVANFNKKIKNLESLENAEYLPDKINYNEIKGNILTRKELKRIIKSLKDFQKETATNLYRTEAGEIMTQWEHAELQGLQKKAIKRIKEELSELNEKTETGFSFTEMGSSKVRELKAQLKNLEKFESVKGREFTRLIERLQNVGRDDYTIRKAQIYMDNYLKEMEKYKNFEGYEELMKKLTSFRNPIKFYNFMKNKNELVTDLTYQSDQYYSQEEFNMFLLDLEIYNESDIE